MVPHLLCPEERQPDEETAHHGPQEIPGRLRDPLAVRPVTGCGCCRSDASTQMAHPRGWCRCALERGSSVLHERTGHEVGARPRALLPWVVRSRNRLDNTPHTFGHEARRHGPVMGPATPRGAGPPPAPLYGPSRSSWIATTSRSWSSSCVSPCWSRMPWNHASIDRDSEDAAERFHARTTASGSVQVLRRT